MARTPDCRSEVWFGREFFL